MNRDSRIFVAGHNGLVGSALVRHLRAEGWANLVLRSRAELDLTDRAAVDVFFAEERPEYVFLAAAKVGGILANSTYPADFIRENLAIELNVIDASYRHGAKKLLFLSSSAIYPKSAPQPLREESLLTGELEPSNEWYSLAKIAGIKLCQAYRQQYGFSTISLVPTNLYGPGDHFDPQSGHVLAAMLRRFHEAKVNSDSCMTVWGSGTQRREFLHVDDLADACIFLMRQYDAAQIVNVGTGNDITIGDLARVMAKTVGFNGDIEFDRSKPDGAPRKLLDVSRLQALGWRHSIALADGLKSTYRWFVDHAG